MKTFLIVEDNPTKAQGIRGFREIHAKAAGIDFVAKSNPIGALNVLRDPTQRAQLAGVIADFELGCRRDDNDQFRAAAIRDDGSTYKVSTGMGVLDWAHSVDRNLPLWALTNDAATHAPLYMTAANLWLDAKPLHVDRFSPHANSTAAADMIAELLDPYGCGHLNPHTERVENASLALGELLNVSYVKAEAFDWLQALIEMTVGTEGFIPALNKTIQDSTGIATLKAHSNTLGPAMAMWQILLDEIYSEFPVDRREELWPVLDRNNLPKNLTPWAEFNPITGFLAKNDECREFFGSADVRVALSNWRARGDRP
ncbi:hypothetical protein ACQ86B_29150 (plasmid) [Mycolicibacterium aichiense]|uniref:hypothetical protein n=1 Tax=Mycolicibacterium aichiense TaxID=1799 RepID=UPI003D67BE13